LLVYFTHQASFLEEANPMQAPREALTEKRSCRSDNEEERDHQFVVRPLGLIITKADFLATMEELFWPSHPVTFIRVEPYKAGQRIVYKLNFSGEQERNRHNYHVWAITTHFCLAERWADTAGQLACP
jgi:hypothetical protein